MSASGNRGQFAKGTSGNRRGRPKKKPIGFRTLAELDEVILGVMNRQVSSGSGGERMTLLEFNCTSLATGKSANPLACRSVIRIAIDCAKREEERIREAEWRTEQERQREEARHRAEQARFDYHGGD